MKLSIFTTSGVREEEVVKVFFPGIGGSFEVMDNHAPMLASLKEGTIRWVAKDGAKEELDIAAGFVKVKENSVNAMVEAK